MANLTHHPVSHPRRAMHYKNQNTSILAGGLNLGRVFFAPNLIP